LDGSEITDFTWQAGSIIIVEGGDDNPFYKKTICDRQPGA
jgi:hypothetical protein